MYPAGSEPSATASTTSARCARPPRFWTVTVVRPLGSGGVVSSIVSVSITRDDATATPPTTTSVSGAKFRPLIVRLSPPRLPTRSGVIDVICGSP